MAHDSVRLRDQLGGLIRQARTRLGFNQEQLAERAGFPHFQTISDIERGARDVKAWELARLAQALHLSVQDLLAPTLPESPLVLWRKEPERPKVAEAAFIERCRQYRFLEELTGRVREVSLPSVNVDPGSFTHGRATALADNIRQVLRLGAKPARALLDALEDVYGIKVWFEDFGEDGAASCTIGSFGPAILINASEPMWRRNFSLAHEVFHLFTWQSLPAERLRADPNLMQKAEALANSFAAALLLPADGIRAELEGRGKEAKIAIQELIDVARQFQVSTDALLWRLANLGWVPKEQVEVVLADADVQRLDSARRRSDWDQPMVPPSRFVRLAHLAYTRGEISRARLSKFLSVDLAGLEDKLAEYGLSDAPGLDAELTATSPL